jgi:miniconductance mechanosensitive channel
VEKYNIDLMIDLLKEFLIFFYSGILSYCINKLLSKYFFRSIKNLIKSNKTPKWFEYRLIKPIIRRIFYFIPGILIYLSLEYQNLYAAYINKFLITILTKITIIYLIFIFYILTISFMTLSELIYDKKQSKKTNISIHPIIQTFKIIFLLFAIIISYGIITNSQLSNIFTGIAGLSAVGAFLFQDMIKNFVSSMQVIFNNLIKIGDWIEIPDIKINGMVKNITLTSIHIEDTNKNIIILPSQTVLSKGIINSRNIIKSGKSLIKNQLNIKVTNIKIISKETFDKLLIDEILAKYLIKEKYHKDISNMELFRFYTNQYLHNHIAICKNGIILVHLLEQKEDFIVIEFIASMNSHDLFLYKETESRFIEHFISVLSKFELQ